MIKLVSIFGIILSIVILSLLFYQWNQERAYTTNIEKIFSKEIQLIEFHSHYNNMPIIMIKEQQKILIIKAWLLNARKGKSFNFAPYPDALDQLIIIQSSGENKIINISPPDPARSKIRYKNYVMFSTPLPDIIEEVRQWNQAYKNWEKMWDNPINENR